jgi:transposase-like protein
MSKSRYFRSDDRRFRSQVIAHAVSLCSPWSLSLRIEEQMLAVRGIVANYKTARPGRTWAWCSIIAGTRD